MLVVVILGIGRNWTRKMGEQGSSDSDNRDDSMTCCVPSAMPEPASRGKTKAPLPSTVHPELPSRIRFAAAETFVGTAHPVIPDDGEGPRRKVTLRAFELEVYTVTNARFADFVRDTGYVTQAERFGWSAVFIGLLPENAVYEQAQGPLWWWAKVEGATWSAPEGPGTTVEGRMDHPVVHVSWIDAQAFAKWCGGRLPTEAEWEHAARGGLEDPRFPWGDEEPSDSAIFCNIWQGRFPHHNTRADGFYGTSPVSAFAPNGAGLHDMAGNVWVWTADAFRIRSLSKRAKLRNEFAAREKEKVLKGGSFLCHKTYCYRYRIAARMALPPDSAASNVGIRIAYDA